MTNDAPTNVNSSATSHAKTRAYHEVRRRPTLRPIPGVLFAMVGLVVAVGPMISGKVAEMLRANLPAGFQVTTVGLVSAGFLIVGAGVLLIALSRIGGSVNEVSRETSQLHDIVSAGQELVNTVATVRSATDAMQKELTALKDRVSKSIEIMEDPDTKTSLFRLAASVNQLGARIEPSLHKRFTEVEAEIAGGAKNTAELRDVLTKKVDQLAARVNGRHQESQVLVQKAFAATTQAFAEVRQHLTDALDQTTLQIGETAKADQVESARRGAAQAEALERKLDAQLGKVREAMGGVTGSVHELGKQHEARLRATAEHLERGFAERASALGAELATVKDVAARGAADVGQALGAFGARVNRTVRERVDEVRQGLQGAIDTASACSREVAAGMRALEAHVNERLQGQHGLLKQGLEQVHGRVDEFAKAMQPKLDAATSGARELTAGLRGLEARFDERVKAQHGAVKQELEQLGKRFDEHGKGVHQKIEAAGASTREVAAGLRGLEARTEERIKGQQGAVSQELGGVHKRLEELGKGLQQKLDVSGEVVHKRLEELGKGLQQKLDVSGAGVREVVAGLRGLEARLDQRVEGQSDVHGELGQVQQRVAELAQAQKREFEAASAGAREIGATLRGLESRVDQRLQGQNAGVKQELDQLREHLGELRHGLTRQIDAAAASARETGTAVRGLETRIGEQVGEQIQTTHDAVHRDLEQVRAAAERAARDHAAALEDLREKLDATLERRFARFEAELVSIAQLAGDAVSEAQDLEMLEAAAGDAGGPLHGSGHGSGYEHMASAGHGAPPAALPQDGDDRTYEWAEDAPAASDEPRAALPSDPAHPLESAHYLAGGEVEGGWSEGDGDPNWRHDQPWDVEGPGGNGPTQR